MSKKIEYKVPDGYFENLKTRLSAIPAQEKQPSRIQKFTPYLALAACFAVAVLVGNLILNTKHTDSGCFSKFLLSPYRDVPKLNHSQPILTAIFIVNNILVSLPPENTFRQ